MVFAQALGLIEKLEHKVLAMARILLFLEGWKQAPSYDVWHVTLHFIRWSVSWRFSRGAEQFCSSTSSPKSLH